MKTAYLATTVALSLSLPSPSASAATSNIDLVITRPVASAPGPLSVLGTNPHYFKTPNGKAIYLAGFHTWTDGMSFASAGPSSPSAMMDYMAGFNVNLVRLWELYIGPTWPGPTAITPLPFNRSATCCASDGGNKFDVTAFNPTFFNYLKANVEYGATKGMYVMPQLMSFYHGSEDFAEAFWNGSNNINGTTADVTAYNTGSDSTTWTLQQSYLRHFLDTLGVEPNVLYEVSNEPDATISGAFENSIIDFVHGYETAKGYGPHPIGAEMGSSLFTASRGDFVIDQDFNDTPGVFALGKPVIVDTDHTFGIGGGTDWWWQVFMNGNNPLSMDDMHDSGLSGTTDTGNTTYYFYEEQNRAAIQQQHTLMSSVDMTAMVPHGELASTGHCLADTSGHKFLVWVNAGGSVTVDLSSASGIALTAFWLNTANGSLSSATHITGGSSSQSFTSPFGSTPAALVITP